MAVVCVSHDVNLAARFADELLLMRAGKVLAFGPPAQVVREDILSTAYDTPVELVFTPGDPVPLIRAR